MYLFQDCHNDRMSHNSHESGFVEGKEESVKTDQGSTFNEVLKDDPEISDLRIAKDCQYVDVADAFDYVKSCGFPLSDESGTCSSENENLITDKYIPEDNVETDKRCQDHMQCNNDRELGFIPNLKVDTVSGMCTNVIKIGASVPMGQIEAIDKGPCDTGLTNQTTGIYVIQEPTGTTNREPSQTNSEPLEFILTCDPSLTEDGLQQKRTKSVDNSCPDYTRFSTTATGVYIQGVVNQKDNDPNKTRTDNISYSGFIPHGQSEAIISYPCHGNGNISTIGYITKGHVEATTGDLNDKEYENNVHGNIKTHGQNGTTTSSQVHTRSRNVAAEGYITQEQAVTMARASTFSSKENAANAGYRNMQ